MTALWVGVSVLLGLWVLNICQYPYVTCTHCDGAKRKYASDQEHYAHTDCWWCYCDGERYRVELRWLTIF